MLKKLMIAALLIIIIGVGGSIIFYNSSNKTTKVNETQSIDYENIDEIQINTISTDIDVIASKKQKEATIELRGKAKEAEVPELFVKVDGTKLVIDLQEKKVENKWFQLSPNFAPPTLALTLYVPENLLNDIEFNGVSADLYLDNVHANTLKLSSTSGDIGGEDLQFKKAQIKTVSGDMELEETIGETSIKTESGDIYLTMPDLVYPLQVKSTSGDVEVVTSKESTDVKFNVKTISGDIDILDEYDGSTVIGKGTKLVDIKTTSGDIWVESD